MKRNQSVSEEQELLHNVMIAQENFGTRVKSDFKRFRGIIKFSGKVFLIGIVGVVEEILVH